MKKQVLGGAVLSTVLICIQPSWAAHPLVSEDTGTQGPGGNQIELNADWARDAGSTTKLAAFTYTRGITENLDLFASLPRTLGAPTGEQTGFNDVSLGAKWRFFEDGGFSLGLKPEWITPSADENRGLGNGKSGYAMTLMAQMEIDDVTVLLNLGATRNHFKLQSDADAKRGTVNRSSIAVLYRLPWGSTILADLGQSDAEDKAEQSKPKFYVLGLIHAVNKNLDIDVGYKKGINTAETDRQWGVGLTWRFAND